MRKTQEAARSNSSSTYEQQFARFGDRFGTAGDMFSVTPHTDEHIENAYSLVGWLTADGSSRFECGTTVGRAVEVAIAKRELLDGSGIVWELRVGGNQALQAHTLAAGGCCIELKHPEEIVGLARLLTMLARVAYNAGFIPVEEPEEDE